MRWTWIIWILALVACDGPGLHFSGVPATRITVDGSVFDVRVRGDLAEAVRINAEYAPRFGPIRTRAGFAMATVSGCKVREVLGDQAVALGRLDCGGTAPRAVSPAPVYSCIDVSTWVNAGPGPDYPEFDCTPD
jgi:hypothetical protein